MLKLKCRENLDFRQGVLPQLAKIFWPVRGFALLADAPVKVCSAHGSVTSHFSAFLGTSPAWAGCVGVGLAPVPAARNRVAMCCACQRFTVNTPNISPQAVLGDCVCLDTCWVTVHHPMNASKFCKISPQLPFLFLEKLPDASLLFCKTGCILPICFPPCFSGGKLNVGACFKCSLNILDRLGEKSKSFSEHRADRKSVQWGILATAGWSGAPGWHRLNGRGLITFIHLQERECFRVAAKPPGERW